MRLVGADAFRGRRLGRGLRHARAGVDGDQPPELLSDTQSVSVMELERADELAGAMDGEVIYIYPVEVTEYYIIVPHSHDLG